MNEKSRTLRAFLALSVICISVSAILALINSQTAPIIDKNNSDKANSALIEVLPGSGDFTEVTAVENLPSSVTNVWKSSGGYVFQMIVRGYRDGLTILCGIDTEGVIAGAKYISSNETLGAEVGLGERFVGHTADTLSPDIIAGPTARMTTEAYYGAIEDALSSFIVLNGGEVDFRSEYEILQDDINAACGTSDVKYEKWFATEVLEGADSVYVSEDGNIYAYFIGETIVGITADGEILSKADGEYVNNVLVAHDAVISSVLKEIDLPEGVNTKLVTGAQVTDSGNYVFSLRAAGYGVLGQWHSSGEYIRLKVCISADGKIISTLTTYQNESENVGDICASPEYYEQFNGKSALDYGNVENVAGATYTTSGYKKAIGAAFDALNLIKGGNGYE